MRGYGRNHACSALHNQQEQFETAAQKHQRVAHEEVQTAAALATSRTAAQMTSRFRDIENNAELSDSRSYGRDYAARHSPRSGTLSVQK